MHKCMNHTFRFTYFMPSFQEFAFNDFYCNFWIHFTLRDVDSDGNKITEQPWCLPKISARNILTGGK